MAPNHRDTSNANASSGTPTRNTGVSTSAVGRSQPRIANDSSPVHRPVRMLTVVSHASVPAGRRAWSRWSRTPVAAGRGVGAVDPGRGSRSGPARSTSSRAVAPGSTVTWSPSSRLSGTASTVGIRADFADPVTRPTEVRKTPPRRGVVALLTSRPRADRLDVDLADAVAEGRSSDEQAPEQGGTGRALERGAPLAGGAGMGRVRRDLRRGRRHGRHRLPDRRAAGGRRVGPGRADAG